VTLVLTTDTAPGQRRLTREAEAAICEHYGWRAPTPMGYIDGSSVYIGSSYAGRIDGEELVLDRNRGGTRGAPRMAVVA
jgi:hypothetical protein